MCNKCDLPYLWTCYESQIQFNPSKQQHCLKYVCKAEHIYRNIHCIPVILV